MEIEKGKLKWKIREFDFILREGYINKLLMESTQHDDVFGFVLELVRIGVEDVEIEIEPKFTEFRYLGRTYKILSDEAMNVLIEKFPLRTSTVFYEVAQEILKVNKLLGGAENFTNS